MLKRLLTTALLVKAMHFVYTFLLINEHFWVTAAKVDSCTHLFLKQIATIWTFTIQIPWETAGMNHTILACTEMSVCVCVCVCGVHAHAQNLREETDVSIINVT